MQQFTEKMRIELRYRNYSQQTINTYLRSIESFFDFLGADYDQFDEFKVKKYLVGLRDREKGRYLKI